MDWVLIISTIVLVIATIDLFIGIYEDKVYSFQFVHVFIHCHKTWKKYRRLKKYLKINTIPVINIQDYEGNNAGFAFIQYDDIIFVIQGDNIYLSSYYKHLINNLLKHNDNATRRALQ